MSKWDYDCAVIGGGPGGLVSALYLRRFLRSVVLVNTGKPRAAWIPRTHNLIGYHRGISGKSLLLNLTRQLARHGAHHVLGEATIARHEEGFEVRVGNDTILARKAILATGITDLQPEVDGVPALRNLGLLRYCPVCDAYEYRREPVSVLVQDDLGVQKALFMRHYTPDLRIILPRDLNLAPQRVMEIRRGKVKVSRGKVIALEPGRMGRSIWIHLDHGKPICSRVAYIELGCTVNDSAFKKMRGIFRTQEGFLTTTSEQRLRVPGLFAVGDCVNLLGQIVVAAAQGAVAATTIHNDLASEG